MAVSEEVSEERRFQEILASLNTRESSALTVATVATSASLVLYGLSPGQNIVTYVAGVLFPIVGFLYRELTIFSIDRRGFLELVRLVGVPRPLLKGGQAWAAQLRRWMLRVFFPFPTGMFLSLGGHTVFLPGIEISIPQVPLIAFVFVASVIAAVLCYGERRWKDLAAHNLALVDKAERR